MKCLVTAILVLTGQVLLAGQEGPGSDSVRFEAVDVFVDAKAAPLAAYQIEFSAKAGDVRIAGIEGGAHPAFATPPFYDPKAMQEERVILAAFSTDAASTLPSGRTRVATIHLQVRGATPPLFQINLQTAADARGNKTPAEAAFEERNAQ
jgi:hypothetical protein